MKKLTVIKKTNTKTGKTSTGLVYFNGYYNKYLTFEREIIIEILDIRPSEFETMPCGEYDIIIEKGE